MSAEPLFERQLTAKLLVERERKDTEKQNKKAKEDGKKQRKVKKVNQGRPGQNGLSGLFCKSKTAFEILHSNK